MTADARANELGWTPLVHASLGCEASAGVQLLVQAGVSAGDWFDLVSPLDDDLFYERGGYSGAPYAGECPARPASGLRE